MFSQTVVAGGFAGETGFNNDWFNLHSVQYLDSVGGCELLQWGTEDCYFFVPCINFLSIFIKSPLSN